MWSESGWISFFEKEIFDASNGTGNENLGSAISFLQYVDDKESSGRQGGGVQSTTRGVLGVGVGDGCGCHLLTNSSFINFLQFEVPSELSQRACLCTGIKRFEPRGEHQSVRK